MIVLDKISKTFSTRKGPHTVLIDVNLEISKGQRLGILGRNGSGKSTLLRIIGGTETPTSGSVIRNMTVSWPLAFTGAFQGSLTGLDNMKFICRIYGVDPKSVQPFVEEFADLGAYFREPLKTYSSGMRARLAFALSMSIEFDCFLIDEVIAVGDSRFHEKCREELFMKRQDRALVLVSHEPYLVQTYCDTLGLLEAGRFSLYQNKDEAYARYNEVV